MLKSRVKLIELTRRLMKHDHIHRSGCGASFCVRCLLVRPYFGVGGAANPAATTAVL